MKEVFLVMDDKQSVGLNYFNRQGIVPAFSEQYLVFKRNLLTGVGEADTSPTTSG